MCDRMFGKQEPVPVEIDRDYILSQATALAREGFRVLAMAAAYPENDTLERSPAAAKPASSFSALSR